MRDQPKSFPPDGDDPLDALLAQARWPEVSDEAQQRLRMRVECGKRPSHWRIIATAGALAACLSICIASVHLLNRQQVRPWAIVPPRSQVPSAATTNVILSRPPTFAEQCLLRLPSAVEPRIRVVVAPRAPARPTQNKPVALRELRLEMLRPALWSSVPDLLHKAKTADLLELTRETPMAQWRQGVAAELLTRPDQISSFLALVRDVRSREPALAALRSAADPPVDALIAQFQSPLVETRLVAAEALGTTCDAATASRLIRMVHQSPGHREALAALLASQNPAAVEFLKKYRTMTPNFPLAKELEGIQSQMNMVLNTV